MIVAPLAVLAAFSSVGVSLFYKLGTSRGSDRISSPALLCTLCSLFVCILFFIISLVTAGGLFFADKLSLILAPCVGLAYSCAAFFYLLSLSCGPYTLSVVMLNLSAFMPILYSRIFLHEAMNLFQTIGFVIMLAACLSLTLLRSRGAASAPITPKWVLLIVITFITNSSISFMLRLHTKLVPEASLNSFLSLAYFCAFLLCLVFFLASGGAKKKPSVKRLAVPALGVAAALSANLYPSAELPRYMPAAFQYPLISGSSVIISTIIGRIFFKERLGAYGYISIAAAIVAMIFTSIS